MIRIIISIVLSFFITTICFSQETIIYANDTVPAGRFGGTMTLGSEILFIGDLGGSPQFLDVTGAVYTFEWNGQEWEQKDKLTPGDLEAGDQFGRSLDIWQETLIVGANKEDDNGDGSGAAYIFQKTGNEWTEQAKLLASDGTSFDRFGTTVSISGNHAAVGAPDDSDLGTGVGAVYVFEKTDTNTWVEKSKLFAENFGEFDRFGFSTDMSEALLVVGSPGNEDGLGSVFIYELINDNWEETVKLMAPNLANNEGFGRRVCISGNRLIIATKYQQSGLSHLTGAAYIFKKSNDEWEAETLLLPFDEVTEDDDYSWSVGINEEYAAFVLPGEHNNGRIFLYQLSGNEWEAKTIIRPSNGNNFDQFARSILLSGNLLFTGASRNSSNPIHEGAGYIYDLYLLLPTEVEPQKSKFRIYPNPADQQLYIKNSIGCINNTLTIYDLAGRPVFQAEDVIDVINLPYLSGGLYLVQVEHCQGTHLEKMILGLGE